MYVLMFLINSVVTVDCCLMASVLKGGLICVKVLLFAISARSINLVCNFSLIGKKIPLHITVTIEHLYRNDPKDLVDDDNLGSWYSSLLADICSRAHGVSEATYG